MNMKRMVEMLTTICMWMLYCADIESLFLHVSFILGENRATTALFPIPPELLGDLSGTQFG